MSLEQLYFVSQIVAAVAIVASLLFVGLQVRQSDKTQRALIHQAMSERQIELNKALFQYPEFFGKITTLPSNLTDTERWQAAAFLRMQISHIEELYWQFKNGLLDAAALVDELAPIRSGLAVPGLRVAWTLFQNVHTAEQRQTIEELVFKDVPVVVVGDLDAQWRLVEARIAAQAVEFPWP